MTDWASIVPTLAALPPYDPGVRVAEVKERHGLDEVVRLHYNENLFGPLPGVLEEARDELRNASLYPEELWGAFKADAAAYVGTTADAISPGHGSQSLIATLARALLRHGDAVALPAVSFYLYAMVSEACGATVHRAPMAGLELDLSALAATARSAGARIVWVCDPNNPTGTVLGRDGWTTFLDALPEGCVAIVDEAYVDFLPPDRRPGRERAVAEGRPVVLLRSFSKLYGLAGLRLGYAVTVPELASYLELVDEPFNQNCLVLAAGRACFGADQAAERRRAEVSEAREVLSVGLRAAGLEPHPSVTNFVLAGVDVDDLALAERVAAGGIMIRPGSDIGLPGFVRITVGPVPLMQRVVGAVQDAVSDLRR